MTPLQPVHAHGSPSTAKEGKSAEGWTVDGHTGVEQAMESSQREFQHPSLHPSSVVYQLLPLSLFNLL